MSTPPTVKTVTTETHELSHEDLVQAIGAFVRARTELVTTGCVVYEVEISNDPSWGQKDKYGATATLTVES